MKQKGAAIRSTLQAIANLYGDDALAKTKAALRKDIRAQIEPTVITVAWYPIEVSAAIHVAIRDTIGNGQWEMSHAIGIEAAKLDFNGIYRVLLRTMQYDTIWDRAQRAWDGYNSGGTSRWTERKPGHAVCTVDGVSGFNRGIWNAVAGRFEGLITLSGARSSSVEVHEATSIGCRLEAMWLE